MKKDWKSSTLTKTLKRIEDSKNLLEKYKTYILQSYSGKTRCPKCGSFKKEEDCRNIFESITGKIFPKKRPDFLRMEDTGGSLELDGYCEDLKLAFEYDGEGHYLPIKYWGGIQGLETRRRRDMIKDKKCEKHGIILIRIPYFIENIEQYIKDSLNGKNHIC